MQLSGLLDLLRDTSAYKALLNSLRTSGKQSAVLGTMRSARPFVAAALARDWGAPVVYLTARIDRAYNVTEQFPVWMGDDAPIYRFAEPASPFYERAPWGESALRNRLATLSALEDDAITERHPLVVTSARALMQRTMPVNTFRRASLTLKVGDRWDIGKLLDRWQKIGYEGTTMVIEPGTFSRRGGILDIYPLTLDRPIRVEFFGDEIDSLRTFDPSTQRSIEKIKQITITPSREALPEHTPPIAASLAAWFDSLPTPENDLTSPLADRDPLSMGSAFPFLETYLPYLYSNPVSLLDYAPENALILVDDGGELREVVESIEEQAAKDREEKINARTIPPDYPQPYIAWEMLANAMRDHCVVYLGHSNDEDENGLFEGLIAPETRFGGQLKTLLTQLRKLRNDGDRVIAVTTQAARLTELWQEQESAFLAKTLILTEPPARRTVTFVEGAMQEGWRLRTGDGDTHLFTDAEVFGWSRPEPRRRKVVRRAKSPEGAYADMHEGDYVVHVDYGVGKFVGMRRRTLEGLEREYLLIEYGGTDTLFVPIHQADRLTRYVGPDDKPPMLHKLGQQDWFRIKGKAKKAVEEEARELLALYAARASAPGHAFGADTPWQHELEASFPYVETEDQLKAVADVKTDMEKPHPMDRLICGDVGYGKTEVALRAAFKAVNDGKQVAILVPTTILAQQHYETFSQRLAAFPIKVEMLSRFRTKEEQNRALKQLEAGEVDIMIGTHRIIQNDVKTKDLGLVIIDEEQRFGVKHKEHLKKMRTQVDVLTLTATPIPRTLFMGLTGVRDISMIQTPPEDRLPVITHVGVFDDRMVRQAVIREMERGGQVFVVHNRINTIDALRERLEKIVPEARVVIGHGQMQGHQLERVMEAYANGEYDILLSTAIIESGLDIPNSNTLIVDRADLFGLAQLYQLRGRVGRGAQQAYAFFFHPTNNRLTEDARARLETLREYTELGSGYQIAMRDLELRGAGDILSTRQTGHVAAIGLNLYTQMLASAVRDLKGDSANGAKSLTPIISENSIIIDLPMPAYLPTDYIPELALRLQLYRRIGGLAEVAEVESMRNELRDRFGELPFAVEGLLFQIEVKILAQAANATHVLHRDDKIEIRLPYLVEVNREQLAFSLGEDTAVTRTAVELTLDPAHEGWRQRLIDILNYLAHHVRAAVGM